jgi:integrase
VLCVETIGKIRRRRLVQRQSISAIARDLGLSRNSVKRALRFEGESGEEVVRLIGAAGNLKHQTALSVAYGAGLRPSEVSALKVGDVDSARMTLRIEQGKGAKDRYATRSPVLLERLRTWWRVARAQGKMLDGGWLVSWPGSDRASQHAPAQPRRACRRPRGAYR